MWSKQPPTPPLRDEVAKFMFANSPDAYCIIDGGKIVECNKAMETIMGCSRAELLGITPEQLSPKYQPDGMLSEQAGAEADRRVATDGFARFEWTHQRIDGTPLPVLVTLMGAHFGDRDVMISMWQDIRELVTSREAEGVLQRRQAEAASALGAVVAEMGAGLDGLAGGDLSTQIETRFPEAYESLRDNFNSAIAKLRGVLSRVVTTASSITSGLQKIRLATNELSNRTEDQAASVQNTVDAISAIAVSINNAAERTEHVQTITAGARQDAEAGGAVVQRAIASMGEIRDASNEVSKVVGVIDEIAFQTNLLALNAAVEAARAGDAGQGFAVVAAEVRRLAQRSTEAARSVKELIGNAATQVDTGVRLVNDTGRALHAIVGRIAEISQVVTEISEAAKSQAGEVRAVNNALDRIDVATKQNAAMVEENAQLSASLGGLADEMQEHVGQFRIDRGAAAVLRRA